MPRGDRTGPWGLGPMTGRGVGHCGGYPAPGYMFPGPGFGFGRGFGFGKGFGRGRGFGQGRGWWGAGFGSSWGYPYPPMMSYAYPFGMPYGYPYPPFYSDPYSMGYGPGYPQAEAPSRGPGKK